MLHSAHTLNTATKLLEDVIKAGYELDPCHPTVKAIHENIRNTFGEYIKSPFSIVNTRAWYSKPASIEFGPSATHTDGFEPGHLKVMIYPEGLSNENGYLEIQGEKINNMPAGTCVAFRNSDVQHKAIPGNTKDRLSVEITLQRTFIPFDQFTPSHFNGRHYANPLHAYYYGESKSSYLPPSQTRLINIGSGVRDWKNWLLLDELSHPAIYPYRSSEISTLPALPGTADLIYSSHHIEHINDQALNRLLIESHRVLSNEGYLLLKYPDYDWFSNEYMTGNTEFMKNKGVESVLWSWKAKGVADSIENRLAMMICGYWNLDYGDHFSGQVSANDNAYHGPAILEATHLNSLLKTKPISEVCHIMRNVALADPEFKAFNHQSAWSNAELVFRAEALGFRHFSSSKEFVFTRFGGLIPDLLSMSDWSSYQVFIK